MKFTASKRIVSLILVLILSFCSSLTLIGCSSDGSENQGTSDSAGNGGNTESGDKESGGLSDDSTESIDTWRDKILAFDEKDYGRGTEDFDKIEYKRPDFDTVFEKTEAVILGIEKNEISFDEQIASIKSIEADYTDVITMRSLVNIYVAKDASDTFWNGELSYIGREIPILLDLIDDMYVAAANSPHAQRFEAEYFGDGLIEKYKDGGRYSDSAIELLKKEEELEAAYTTLSTATVEISFDGASDTPDNILEGYREKYNSAKTNAEKAIYLVQYKAAYDQCTALYEIKSKEILTELFVELVKVRRKIANELGHKSYAEYAYEQLGRDYSYEKASAFIDDISEYIVPVYYMLSFTSLGKYLSSNAPVPREITLDELINNSYYALNSVSEEYGDVYRYMLQHNLYDVDLVRQNRSTGSFMTYINAYRAPYIFMSASGNISDYTTMIHEFGHFADAFINNNSQTSIDQSEVSSQALEYLMLTKLGGVLDADDRQYLIETSMLNALTTLILQGFFAKVEELVYALPLERITKEELDRQVVLAAEKFSLNTNYFKDISSVFMTHTFVYPFYVQSYCTSLIPALEIFFTELREEGSGFDAYRKLIDRTEKRMTFEESLSDALVSSPFETDIVKETALKIRDYLINGSLPLNNDTKNESAA